MSLLRASWPTAVAAVLLLGAGATPAAPTDDPRPTVTGSLSLEDAVKLSLTYNRDLQKAVEEREVAHGRIHEAWGEALPQITLDARYDRREQESGFDIFDPASGRNVFIQFGYLNNYSTVLNVKQPVFQGGRAAAALRGARLYTTFADEAVRGATQSAIYESMRAYYRVLLAREQITVAESSLKLAESLLRDVQTKRKYGVASDFNVLRAQVEVSNSRAGLIGYKNALHTATADLFRTLGVSQDSDVVLAETLAYAPRTADEKAAFDEALRSRPDLKQADLSVKLRGEAVKVARAEFFPRFEAFFTDTYAKPDPVVSTKNEWGNVWSAGLTMSFNVFDGGRRRGRLMQQQAVFRQARIDLDDARERARVDVTKSVLTLGDAAEAVDVQGATLEQANEGLRLAEVGYREGTLDQVAVLEARNALTQAQLLYFRSLHDHAVARLDLARAQGILIPPSPDGTGR